MLVVWHRHVKCVIAGEWHTSMPCRAKCGVCICHVATHQGIPFTKLRLFTPCERIWYDVQLEITLLCKLRLLKGNSTLQLLRRIERVMEMNVQFPLENNKSGVFLFPTHIHTDTSAAPSCSCNVVGVSGGPWPGRPIDLVDPEEPLWRLGRVDLRR